MNNKLFEQFVKERKLISSTSHSSIYFWNGYAYKCFIDTYPDEWIEYEYRKQKIILKSNLNVVKYYPSEFKRTIKMDYIKGKTLAGSFNKKNDDKLLNGFINEFIKMHEVKKLKLDDLCTFLIGQIDKAPVTKTQKNKAKDYIKEIETKDLEDNCLCHMDYHFLNVMYSNRKIFIIDWIDARSGKAIYDYARAYVMIYEYAARFKNKYLKKILSLMNYDSELFIKAIYINAINRLEEYDDSRVRKLIELIEKKQI